MRRIRATPSSIEEGICCCSVLVFEPALLKLNVTFVVDNCLKLRDMLNRQDVVVFY